MSTSSEFIELIHTAFLVNDNQQRQEAERKLVLVKEQSVDDFLRQCVSGFTQESHKTPLRCLCGTLLSRVNNQEQSWLKATQETKTLVKNSLLSQLVVPDQSIKRTAANCIASICAIELPRGEWPGIVTTLVQNTNHEQVEIRKAAIMTLGYICESLKSQKQSIDNAESEKVLYGICQGLQPDQSIEEIRMVALKALQDSLTFMSFQFQQKNTRDYVTQLLLETIIAHKGWIRVTALQCLIDYSTTLFDYLNEYIQSIWNCTSICLGGNEEEAVIVAAMEVWHGIATEVVDRSASTHRMNTNVQNSQRDQLIQVHSVLLQAILQNLLKQTEDYDEDDEENNLQEAAYKAAAAIAEAVGPQCYQLFTVFIENTLQSQEWIKRKAALRAFAALIEATDQDSLLNFSKAALEEFVKKLGDPNKQVVIAASKTIAKIAENYPEAIVKHQSCLQITNQLVSLLTAAPNLVKHVIYALGFITEFMRKIDSELTQYVPQLMQSFTALTARQELQQTDSQLIDLAWAAILNLMHCIHDNEQLYQYLNAFGGQLKNTYTLVQWRREPTQSGLLAAIHAGFLKLNSKKAIPVAETVKGFYQIVIEYFHQNKAISSDGLYAISAIAQYSRKQFTPFANDYVQSCLQLALQQVQEPETFKAAVLCLADLARSLLEAFIPYLPIMDYLIKCIQDPMINRQIKLSLFVCISDIILSTGMATEKYYQPVIELINGGFQAGIQYALAKDSTQQEYAENLNETIINSFMCLTHAYNTNTRPFLPLYSHLPQLLQFINTTTETTQNPPVDYIRGCLSCLTDCISFYKNVPGQQEFILQLVNSPIVKHLFETLKKFINSPDNYDALMYAKDTFKTMGFTISID